VARGIHGGALMGRPRKLEPRLHLHLKIDAELRKRLDRLMKREDMKRRGAIAQCLNEAIRNWLEDQGY